MIITKQLTKKFEDFTALDHLDCTIEKGCIYGMVGSNGAGKSTFLRLITGVYQPTEGSVLVEDEPIFENTTLKNKIAYVPDELYFLPGASLKRMQKFYKTIYTGFDDERFQYLVNAFGLDPKKSLNTFSKGMKRQAATILAISSKPDYLFFDETFDGLDPIMRNLVKKLICDDVAERKATAIITSHSLRELEDTCDQLSLLHKGGLVLQSDVSNLKTSLFKVQVAFREDYNQKDFEQFELLHYKKTGSVFTLIVRGDREQTIATIQAKNPVLLDILPLTLEEIFTYEMEALGYAFENVLDGLQGTNTTDTSTKDEESKNNNSKTHKKGDV